MDYMMKIDFEEEFGKLVKWFRASIKPDHTQIAYNKIKFYPVAGLAFAVDFLIENLKPTPSQFPTVNEIINLIMKWLDSHPEEKFKRTEFDTYEDFKYPLSKLWDGYNILVTNGMDAFNRFAEKNRMPSQDRERVVMKYNVSRAKKTMPDLTNGVGKTVET